ncbi:hypothetical protein G7054_g12864 [Neopestalotiopsis clavispora]|nr:hypothetical protein G7054_g12864 [Neopestalotiopsis clavispora]
MATFLVAGIGAFGAVEAIRQTQSRARRDEHRGRKNNLQIHCTKSSDYGRTLEGRNIVLSGDKLYVDTGTDPNLPFGHPFTGYYLAFPDAPYEGLVSTICDDPPIMNWIYVDRNTYEVKFGTRPYAEANYSGPFDCTRQDRRLVFAGWEGFLAVQEGIFWSLYFDVERDKLKSRQLPEGTTVLEVQLRRIEMLLMPPEVQKHKEGESEHVDAKNTPRE